MDKETATILDATTFRVSDLVGPVIVIEAAANHLLSRLPEVDPYRWKVTEALGAIVAARKSLESASETLLHMVSQDGADMLAVEVTGGKLVEKNLTGCVYCDVRSPCPYHGLQWDRASQCPSRAVLPGDTEQDQPSRCRLDVGHVGIHDDHEFRWTDAEAVL